MLDFKELSEDGQDLELLIRELLLRRGFTVHWSGKGADGGRDLVCVERRSSFFVEDERRWLIQCKHNAVSGKSVGIRDLDDIVTSCAQHRCTGYVLACSTVPSSAVVQRLEEITKSPLSGLTATYWDAVKIEQLLTTPRNWPVAQRFFAKSANAEGWRIYATERPNHWIVNFQGYYFHLTNRVASTCEHHLASIKRRIKDINNISLPKNHVIRIRSVYYDDKNGGYTWYLDYMYPTGEDPATSSARIAYALGNDHVLDDGQCYNFEVMRRSYLRHSDHHDFDHYGYYVDDVHAFQHGYSRSFDLDERMERDDSYKELKESLLVEAMRSFEKLLLAFKSLPFARVMRSCNAQIEGLTRFYLRHSWSEVIQDMDLETDRFFSAFFVFDVLDIDKFLDLVSSFPLSVDQHFRLTEAYIYMPSDNGKRSVFEDGDGQRIFDLTLSIHPILISDMTTGRSLLNAYFEEIAAAIDEYKKTQG